VHVWCAALDTRAPERLEQTLSPAERDRANRFRFPRDRRRFVAAHGLLRELLAAYVRTPPSALRFVESAHGKPALGVEQASGGSLRFNMSHSGELALYAVADDRDVGVDVEQLRPLTDLPALAERYFTPLECRQVFGARPAERAARFFACWTRKEALLKAWGQGVSLPLEQVDARPGLSDVPRLGDPAAGVESAGWAVYELAPADGYVGALAARGTPSDLRYWCW
jgi:4'-phosphopantetheinyl transferase